MGNFLFGLGIGIAVGVLVAPKSGSETRRYIADKTAQGTDFVVEHGRQFMDTTSDLIDRGRNVVMSQKEKLGDMVSQMTGEGRREYQSQRQPM